MVPSSTAGPSLRDARVRALVKAISWRLLGTLGTSLIVLAFTGRWGLALSVGGAEGLTKIGLFFVHERLWDRVAFGHVARPQAERAANAEPDDRIRPSR